MQHKYQKDIKRDEKSIIETKILQSKKDNAIYLNNLFLKQIPDQVFNLENLKILNFGFNNLDHLTPAIANLINLKELYLNNNPLQFIPIEISKCKNLIVLKLNDTYLKFLPREMCVLKKLKYLDLNNTLIDGKLKLAYEKGLFEIFFYLQRKYDRSVYRELLVKQLKEWIYVGSSYEEIQEAIQIVMDSLKQCNTQDLKRLFRNFQHIFPQSIQEVNGMTIKEKLFSRHGMKQVTKKDLFEDLE